MINILYAGWILFWFFMAMKCVADDFNKDKKYGNVPDRVSGIVWEYIAPFVIVVVFAGFAPVWCVATFISWVA